MTRVNHVFVLMLENRSFDHMFGLSGLVPAPPSQFGFTGGASDQLKRDPPHEFDDVASQIAGGAMTGFGASGTDAIRGVDPAGVPVLTKLARNYLLMDNWFSSMPGPTWPNRLFAHAASSGGLDNSLSALGANSAITDPTSPMYFDKGHVFQRLTGAGKSWRIYQGDRFPQVLALEGMVEASDYSNQKRFFRPMADFAADLKSGDAASYTWIEPDYGLLTSFKSGNSQHPLGAISAGEALIGKVYNAVRSSSCWDTSVLLVVWDEHGGFFDHVNPPAAVPPGDHPWNSGRARHPRKFAFDRLGPRVPALLISPLLPAGLGSTVFPGQVFDHASIVSSLRSTFELGGPLTARDAVSPSWTSALLTSARQDAICGVRAAAAPKSASADEPVKGPPSDALLAAVQVAHAVDWQLARHTGTAPLASTSARSDLEKANAAIAAPNLTAARATTTHRLLVDYVAAVDAKAAAAEKRASKVDTPTARKKPAQRRPGPAATPRKNPKNGRAVPATFS